MKFGQAIGRCLPKQIQFKRETAHFPPLPNSGYLTTGKLCNSYDVVKGSSKPLPTHCQNRYPSPNGWSDHTRVRPPTPFRGAVGRVSAGFDHIARLFRPLMDLPRESFPCDMVLEVANLAASGAKKSGDLICSKSFPSFPCWVPRHPCRPAKALASNARPWVPLAALWRLKSSTPMSPVARLSAVSLGPRAIRPVFAPTNLRANTTIKGRWGIRPGGPLLFSGAV
jgi:hypothetical protein